MSHQDTERQGRTPMATPEIRYSRSARKIAPKVVSDGIGEERLCQVAANAQAKSLVEAVQRAWHQKMERDGIAKGRGEKGEFAKTIEKSAATASRYLDDTDPKSLVGLPT